MTRSVPTIALLFAAGLTVSARADEPLPWKLTPRWESSAGHRGEEWLVAFSRDGKLAFFNQRSGRIHARDTATWQKAGRLLIGEKEAESRPSDVVVESPDGRYRADSEESEKPTRFTRGITLVDARTKAPLAKVSAAHRTMPVLLFSHDSKTLISASRDALIVWDVPKLQRPRTLSAGIGDPRGSVTRLVLSPDGQTLGVTTNYYRTEDHVWDLKSGRLKASLGGHTAQVWSLAFSPDGKTIASRGNDPQIKLWDAATGLNTRSIPLESGHAVRPVVYSPDGKSIATGDDALVRVFDARTGKPTLTLKGHTSNVNALAFSPDGKQLVSGSGLSTRGKEKIELPGQPGEVVLWDLRTGKARHTWEAHALGAFAVAFSPDGALVATGGGLDAASYEEMKDDPGRAIHLWDAKTGKRVRSIPVRERYKVGLLAFSPDGKQLVHNADKDGASALRVVAVDTGKEVRHLPGAGSAIAFSKDGAMLASVGGGAVVLWDAKTGKLLAQHTGIDRGANAAAFHPDGRSLVTAGDDAVIRRWGLAPAAKK